MRIRRKILRLLWERLQGKSVKISNITHFFLLALFQLLKSLLFFRLLTLSESKKVHFARLLFALFNEQFTRSLGGMLKSNKDSCKLYLELVVWVGKPGSETLTQSIRTQALELSLDSIHYPIASASGVPLPPAIWFWQIIQLPFCEGGGITDPKTFNKILELDKIVVCI